MKIQTDNIKEQQSAAIPKIQQEHSTGGTTTIVDNRPSTVYQRKLRETMNAHAADKALPIQCKPDKTERVNRSKKHGTWISSQIKNPKKSTWEETKVEEEEDEPKKINPYVLHDGVKETGSTNKRKVWEGEEYYKKTPARSFTSPFPSSYLHTVIEYKEPELAEYAVEDENTPFYTAVKQASAEKILEEGLDPNYGNNPYPAGRTAYNTRGFNYFGLDTQVPKVYGSKFVKGGFTILTFKMPKGTTFEVDPEIPNGCRTQTYIDPGWFINPKDGKEG